MKKRGVFSIGAIVVVLGLLCPAVNGQNELQDDAWDVTFSPYFFLPSIKGKSTISGQTSSIDVSFDDIIDNFDVFAVSGRVEAWKGDWGIFFDGSYMGLDGDFKITGPAGPVGIDMEIVDSYLEFGGAYRLVKEPLEESGSRMLTFEPLGGVRYHYFKQKAKLEANHPLLGPIGTTVGGDEEWVEPFVGGRLRYDLSEKLAAIVRADFGGFGIGSASKLTWNLWAGIGWQFKEKMSLKLAYRVYDVDYSRHSGADEFGFDAKMQGPVIGLTMRF